MTTNRDIQLQLHEAIHDYQGLNDLLVAYEELASLLSTADDLSPERTGVLLDFLNCRLDKLIESLNGAEKSLCNNQLTN